MRETPMHGYGSAQWLKTISDDVLARNIVEGQLAGSRHYADETHAWKGQTAGLKILSMDFRIK